jgi:hypothetical protein
MSTFAILYVRPHVRAYLCLSKDCVGIVFLIVIGKEVETLSGKLSRFIVVFYNYLLVEACTIPISVSLY